MAGTPWRAAMERALYLPGSGFFSSGRTAPADHFRTSVHASPLFAAAVLRLLLLVDRELGRPAPVDLIDVGAGRGELLAALLRLLTAAHPAQPAPAAGDLVDRLRLTAVELAPRPDGLPDRIFWRQELPDRVTGLLIATEWLDNVPLDVAEVDPAGTARLVLVDPAGVETLGDPVPEPAAGWLRRWWPLAGAPPGTRAEIGDGRDRAWAAAVSTLDRGLAVAVDYGHLAADRPPDGTLVGYRAGRITAPVPDGTGDVTAHVAIDAVAAAAEGETGITPALLTQRAALRALGVTGRRPPLALASTDPAGYVRALAAASQAAELTDPDGLGGHWWLLAPTPDVSHLPGRLHEPPA